MLLLPLALHSVAVLRVPVPAVWPLLLAHVGPLPLAPTNDSSNSPPPPPTSSPFFVPRDRLAVALHVDLRAGEMVALTAQSAQSGDSAGSGGTSEQYAPLLNTLSHLHTAVGEFVLQPTGNLSAALLAGDEQATQLHKVRPAATRIQASYGHTQAHARAAAVCCR